MTEPGQQHDQPALTVSAIVPLHNGAKHIVAALDSIATQTRAAMEIIVVDDGSSDQGMAVVDQWTQETARTLRTRSIVLPVNLITQANAGPGAARNTAVAAAQGSVFAFLDQDDVWHPAKLALQLERMEREPQLDVVLAHMETRLVEGVSLPDWMRERQLGRQPGWLPGTLVARRRAFEQIGLFDTSYRVGSDFEWFGRMRDKSLNWTMLDEVLLTHFIHSENQSGDTRGTVDLLRAVRASIERRRSGA